MIMNEIVGYKKFKSKAGRDCVIVTVLSPVSNRDRAYGAIGKKATDVFVPDNCHNLITEKILGKEIILQRDFDGTICGIEIK